MRQQLINQPSASSTRSTGRSRRRERAVLKSNLGHASSGQMLQSTAGHQSGAALTAFRRFTISLMFLAPMGALGTLCFALVQNNLKLHQKNDELTGIANEVRTEINVLSEEIETLQQRAGVLEDKTSPEADAAKENTVAPISSVESDLPRGGLAKEVDALDLLKDAKAQVPRLNRALDSAAKPLEATLAAEAAYPNGLPLIGYLDISSEFGLRNNPFNSGSYEVHEGTDFIGNVGDIIAATGEGVVTLAGSNGGYGNTVTIDHGYGYETLYAHMSKVRVKVSESRQSRSNYRACGQHRPLLRASFATAFTKTKKPSTRASS